jgi:hypothetical protein
LLFQTLDDKQECVGVYFGGELLFGSENLPSNLTATWKYAPYLSAESGIEYASLYAQGKTISDMCPDHLNQDWEKILKTMLAHQRALRIGQVSLGENCLWEVIPEAVLKEFCEVRNLITEHVLKNLPRPLNYDLLLSINKMIEKIRHQKLNIDTSVLKNEISDPVTQTFVKKVKKMRPEVVYNLFGTKTGRLATHTNTFPILNIKKEFRKILKPNNDFFVELDFNGAELRVLLALLGHAQPPGDVHEWNLKNVFQPGTTRDEAKTAFFAWLYGSRDPKLSKYSKSLEAFYDKSSLLDKYWDQQSITTEYGRNIPCDAHHALNFLIQSTSSDITLSQMVKINDLLEKWETKTKIAFTVHDSVVLDFSIEDRYLLGDIRSLMSATRWGNFEVGMEIGKDYGNMKKMRGDV